MSRAPARRVCLVVAALVVAPRIASAQILAPWPFLPLEFTLAATLEERYTDNFFLGTRKVEDFRTTLSPSFTLGLSTGRNRSDLRYALSVADSTARTDNPRIFNALDGTDRLAVSERVSLVIRELLAETDEPGIADVRGIQQGRSTATNNSATATLAYTGDLHSASLFYASSVVRRESEAGPASASGTATDTTTGTTEFRNDSDTFGANGRLALGRRTWLEPGASYTTARFSTARGATSTAGATSSTSGFTGYQGTLGLGRELPGDTKAGLTGSYTLRQPDAGRDFTITRGFVTVARPLTPLIDIAAAAGYEQVSGAVELSAPSGTITLAAHGAVFSVVLAGGQSVKETFQDSINAGLIRTRDLQTSVTYAPTDRVKVVTTGAIANTRFLQPDVAASQATVAQSTGTSSSTTRESTLYSFDVALVVKLTRIFSGTIGYSYRKRDVTSQTASTTTSSGAASGLGGFEANTFTVSLTGAYE